MIELWRAHMCGVCLTLRDRHGQWARATLNTDAIAASVLLEAQQPISDSRVRAGRCALRGMQPAEVISANSLSVRIGAATSLTLAAAKAADEVGEHELNSSGHTRARAAVARGVVGPLRRHAGRDPAVGTALDTAGVIERITGQAAIEQRSVDLDEIVAETERACAEVFAATADLAGRPDNRARLATIGAAFGRCGHLVDAVEDRRADRASGAYNLIDATGVSIEEVHTECRRLHRVISDEIGRLELRDDRLVRAMLVRGLGHSISDAFAPAAPSATGASRAGSGPRALLAVGAALCAVGPGPSAADGSEEGWCARVGKDCGGDCCGDCCCDGCDCCDCGDCCDCS
ncbi:DUF5685 family protein [Williamsia maris]|uniref:Regulatory protein n=1 Tax=Williamsia maris TaxID=72806 RepID=A0ABT1HKI2_9NOCA|nr:DUF5685 family protein [Williamsia maris]MCP2178449.1 hypothetical protein [Williamsia maris]